MTDEAPFDADRPAPPDAADPPTSHVPPAIDVDDDVAFETPVATPVAAPFAPPFAAPPAPRPRGAALRAGAVAAAATAGALVAFGLRDDGNVFAPFAAAGRLLLGIAATEGRGATLLACVAGLAVHLGVCLLWGALFALIAARRGPWRLAITAALLALAVYSASMLWLPAVLQLGYALRATKPQLVVLHALLAAGLWSGTRIAQLHPRNA